MHHLKSTLTQGFTKSGNRKQNTKRVVLAVQSIVFSLLFLIPASSASAHASNAYTKTILASDVPGMAPNTDPNLVNPWGLSHSPTGPWWISDADTGKSSIYNDQGASLAPAVSIPSASGSGAGSPTGNIFNKASLRKPDAFVVKKGSVKGPSTFLFATEDGTISGWNKTVDSANAIVAVNRSAATDGQGDTGAVYKGLAAGSHHHHRYIYATNFRFGTVEMFDENFQLVKSFTDPQLTATCAAAGQCYAPFGIQNIQGKLYVTFALQQAGKEDDQAGVNKGFVDVFETDGTLQKRLITRGNLNAPWGLALAPHNFGRFSHHLLVGNFGDGTINVYDLHSGNFDGTLQDNHGNPMHIDGLWGLAFGNNGQAGKRNELFFTAGINDEAHGIFGKITKQ